jgi:energy-converting hydrogenase B subunit Q
MKFGLEVRVDSGLGTLHQLTGVIAKRQGNITLVEIVEEKSAATRVYFEIETPDDGTPLLDDLRQLPIVQDARLVKTLQTIYGKRIIIVGGGAQVGQVAIGAIAEADRHNIRGEHISVDTIPLVGEQPLADAVRAVARLPRAKALVLAGALMGGDRARGPRPRAPRRQSQHGRQRPSRRRPRGHRSGSGRRHDRHGHRRNRQIHRRPADASRLLTMVRDRAASR